MTSTPPPSTTQTFPLFHFSHRKASTISSLPFPLYSLHNHCLLLTRPCTLLTVPHVEQPPPSLSSQFHPTPQNHPLFLLPPSPSTPLPQHTHTLTHTHQTLSLSLSLIPAAGTRPQNTKGITSSFARRKQSRGRRRRDRPRQVF